MKSVCIISKGPSVLKCNTSFYNQFDEIIGINWPLYNQDYSKYLPKKIDIMISSQPIITPNEIKKHRNINLHNYTQQNYDIKQGLYYYCKNVSHNSIVYDCHNKKQSHNYINNLPYNFPDKNYYYISNTTFNIHKNLNKIDSNFIIK